MRLKLRRSGVRIALAAFVIIGGSAGVAYATGAIASGSDAVIVGCAKNDNGQLRLVNDPSQCLPSERAVAFQAPLSTPGPQSVVVDCAAGQTVTQALAQTADAPSVDITIKGTCTESVRIARDDVTLRGAATGDGLQAPSSSAGVLTIDAGRHIRLGQLKLAGGRWGLSVLNGASVNGFNVEVDGATDQDVTVNAGTSLSLNNATIAGGGEGVSAQFGGSVVINGGTISGTQSFGVHAHEDGSIMLAGGAVVTDTAFHAVVAQTGGSVLLQQATVQNSAGTGVFAFQGGSVFVTRDALVRNNKFGGVGANAGVAEIDGHVTGNGGCGVCGFNGGHITVQDGALIDANHGDGVQAGVGSTLAVQKATIKDNTNAGIHLQGTASAGFNGDNTITGNGWWGIFCDGPPAVAQIQAPQGVGTVSGNAAGQINCPTS
jgi:hypothetical protein